MSDLLLKLRLLISVRKVSPGDTGWDVFSLDYHVDGPIRTVSASQNLKLLQEVVEKLLTHCM